MPKLKNYKNKFNTNNIFAPFAPPSWKQNPVEWLNSYDIINVMKQYEKKYPKFKFIGPSPIDFDKKLEYNQCVWNELCNINLKNLINKGIRYIGIVFNTDTHDKSGSHWICMYINLEEKYIFYFDSNADKIPDEITEFENKLIKQANNIGIKLKLIHNQVEHQKTNTECGMYVLTVIILLLKKIKKPKDFNKRLSDKLMIYLRKVIFN